MTNPAARWHDWAVVGVISIGLLLRFGMIAQPVEWMFSQFIPDDAAFYLVLARNIAAAGHVGQIFCPT